MAEYITKEAAKNAINHNYPGFWAAIDALPTADVVPVVRCENCAFSRLDGWLCGGTALMPQHQTYPNSFCECGAKRDGGALS